jgi:hypothetical protein
MIGQTRTVAPQRPLLRGPSVDGAPHQSVRLHPAISESVANGSAALPSAKALVEGIGIRPADCLDERIDVVASLGAVIHVIRMLIHVQREDRLPTGQRRRVVRGPGDYRNQRCGCNRSSLVPGFLRTSFKLAAGRDGAASISKELQSMSRAA